jgi:hypothetical protein
MTVYFSYFHSVMSYGIIFLGSSNLSNNILKIQKRAIRIIANKFNRDSCRQLFNQYLILTLTAQYIFSFVIFVVRNNYFFRSNSEIHDLNTRYKHNLHFPATNLALVQKVVLYSATKIFNHLRAHINLLVTRCTNSLTLKNCTFCPRCIYVFRKQRRVPLIA